MNDRDERGRKRETPTQHTNLLSLNWEVCLNQHVFQVCGLQHPQISALAMLTSNSGFICLLIYLLSFTYRAKVRVHRAKWVAEINCNCPSVELKLFVKRNIKSIMRTTIGTKTNNQKTRTSETFPESVPVRPPGGKLVSRVAKLVKADLAVFGSLSPHTYTSLHKP